MSSVRITTINNEVKYQITVGAELEGKNLTLKIKEIQHTDLVWSLTNCNLIQNKFQVKIQIKDGLQQRR